MTVMVASIGHSIQVRSRGDDTEEDPTPLPQCANGKMMMAMA